MQRLQSSIEQSIGIELYLDQLAGATEFTTDISDLCFRPFDPPLEAGGAVIWKKYQLFSKPAELLLERMMAAFGFQRPGD